MVIPHTLLPNIERDGHHGVEDDDVGPEREEGREGSIVAILSWQEDRELRAFAQLPEAVSYCQDEAHEGQENKNLRGKFLEKRSKRELGVRNGAPKTGICRNRKTIKNDWTAEP